MLRLAELALSHCASRLVPTVGSAASETHFCLRSLPLGEVTVGDYGNRLILYTLFCCAECTYMPQEPTPRQVVLLLFPVASVIMLGCCVADDLKPWDAPPFSRRGSGSGCKTALS
jgi:hypothetical protein